jgi:Ca2+-binding RTX toxin-like protein
VDLLVNSLLDESRATRLPGAETYGYVGSSVAAAGDVDGDGFADFIIGARGRETTGNTGAGYVIFGDSSGFTSQLAVEDLNGDNGFKLVGESASDYCGFSVSGAGDVNGDGISDLLIGAPYRGNFLGSAYVVFGTDGGFAESIDLASLNGSIGFEIRGEAAGDRCGWSVASAGDLNHDGLSDLLINARGAQQTHVVFGASSFSSNFNIADLNGENGFSISHQAGAEGGSVALAGDVNGDGLEDLLIGAPTSVFVVFGRATGFGADLDLSTLNGSNGFSVSGVGGAGNNHSALAGAGDLNGDGLADIVIGDPISGAGAAYVIFGRDSDFDATLDVSALNGDNGFTLNPQAGSSGTGYAVSIAGDVNGDGIDDLLLSDQASDGSDGNSYVVFGRTGGFGASFDLSSLGGTDGLRIGGEGDLHRFGHALSGAGDIDGDGFDDLLIGAYGWSAYGYGDYDGAAYLILGGDYLGVVDSEGTSGNDSLVGDPGDNILVAGVGNDTLEGGDGNDVLKGGNGDDWLAGGAGNDRLIGGQGFDIVSYADESAGVEVDLGAETAAGASAGSDGVESVEGVVGSALNDMLTGDADANLLDGDAGDDTLTGAAGSDIFRVAVDAGADLITDFSGRDSIDVAGVDLALPVGDGDGGAVVAGAVDVSSSDGTTTLHIGADSIAGADLSVTLSGTFTSVSFQILDGDLVLVQPGISQTGTDGADTLEGDTGPDTLTGLGGDDIYFVNHGGDVVVEAAGAAAGDDEVRASIDYALPANVEDLFLIGTAAINGTGNNLVNLIVGNAGANRIDGGALDDVLEGGGGDDTYVVDNTNDQVNELADAGLDTVESTVTYILPAHVESIQLKGAESIGARGNGLLNTLAGNAAANLLEGMGGEDSLVGGAGNDTLDGGEGADTMRGGAGDDTYLVDNAADVVIETSGQGNDVVRSSVTRALGDHQEDLVLTGGGASNGTGNGLANQLIGNNAANVLRGLGGNDLLKGADLLTGDTGADTLIGGTGDDTYYIDSATDVVSELSGQGRDQVYTTINLKIPDHVEGVTVVNTAALFIIGNGLNNFFQGNNGNDSLSGGGGNDTLEGGRGKDRLDGGRGQDRLKGGAGDDLYIVDNARDKCEETSNAPGGLILDGAADGHAGPAGITDTVIASVNYSISTAAFVENLALTGSASRATGNTLANRLTGNAGSDTLEGGSGNDTLDGGAGTDRLIGGTGSDVLVWGAGDRLDGGGGGDTLSLGRGDLDLRAVSQFLIVNVEKADLRGDGRNVLTLTQRDVLDMSSTDAVEVLGDKGDRVVADGFARAGKSGALVRYQSGLATLLVESDVAVVT